MRPLGGAVLRADRRVCTSYIQTAVMCQTVRLSRANMMIPCPCSGCHGYSRRRSSNVRVVKGESKNFARWSRHRATHLVRYHAILGPAVSWRPVMVPGSVVPKSRIHLRHGPCAARHAFCGSSFGVRAALADENHGAHVSLRHSAALIDFREAPSALKTL